MVPFVDLEDDDDDVICSKKVVHDVVDLACLTECVVEEDMLNDDVDEVDPLSLDDDHDETRGKSAQRKWNFSNRRGQHRRPTLLDCN